jgi:hypothetical protein
VSIASVGCVVWLSRFQPVFASLAVCSLAYQGWLVWKRPRYKRTRMVRIILWGSMGTNLGIAGAWLALWLRYQ